VREGNESPARGTEEVLAKQAVTPFSLRAQKHYAWGRRSGPIQANIEGEASVLWVGSCRWMKCGIGARFHFCQFNDHPNNVIGGIQCQC
jgi:hypothetical protein